MANRLDLDFSLNTNEERAEFVRHYVERPEFAKKPLSESELETISNYILWGKDPITGKNVVQSKEIQIETKNKTWDAANDIESLDALMESPTFNEASLKQPTEVRPKVAREVFDRKAALAEAPEHLIPTYLALFRQIDELDLAINFYDYAHGRRKKEPRSSLINKFLPEEQNRIYEMTTHWNQFKYLKQRHLLVELRREQFTLRDSYKAQIQHQGMPGMPHMDTPAAFDADINVLPLGLYNDRTSQIVFKEVNELNPSTYTEEELKVVSRYLWNHKNQAPTKLSFDFRELEHVYQLFLQFFDLETDTEEAHVENTTNDLLRTLEYYVRLADLPDAQGDILQMKMKKIKNQDIADYVNKKYQKSYTANYISTIFRQKIIPKINETAAFHEEIVGNLFFEENFKECSCCGINLLMDAENFVRKSRSKDGFSNRCKKCDREERQRKKGGK